MFWIIFVWNNFHWVTKFINNLRLIYYAILYINPSSDRHVPVFLFLSEKITTEHWTFCLLLHFLLEFRSRSVFKHHIFISGSMNKWTKQITYLPYLGNLGRPSCRALLERNSVWVELFSRLIPTIRGECLLILVVNLLVKYTKNSPALAFFFSSLPKRQNFHCLNPNKMHQPEWRMTFPGPWVTMLPEYSRATFRNSDSSQFESLSILPTVLILLIGKLNAESYHLPTI